MNAAALIEVARPTTLVEPKRLGARLGVDLVIASETLQHTGSFKLRAAYQVAAHSDAPMILTASSGNYGQAMAWSCARLGKRCLVVMPATSAQVKVQAVREYGGEVDLIDVRQVSRAARVAELAHLYPEAHVASAYDDPLVIDGNASLGDEIARRLPDLDAVLVPVGGGGLSSGVLTGLRRSGSRVPVWGAEPLAANDAARSLREGRIVANEREPDTIADGARTVSLGKHNWAVLEHGLAGILEVPEAHIAEAVRLCFGLANLKVEPTGALAVAALVERRADLLGKRVCCVVSGGNVDEDVYCRLLRGDAL